MDKFEFLLGGQGVTTKLFTVYILSVGSQFCPTLLDKASDSSIMPPDLTAISKHAIVANNFIFTINSPAHVGLVRIFLSLE